MPATTKNEKTEKPEPELSQRKAEPPRSLEEDIGHFADDPKCGRSPAIPHLFK